jgi:hypothetical protein
MAQRYNRLFEWVPDVHHPAAGPTGRCPVQPNPPLGPDQVNVLLLLAAYADDLILYAETTDGAQAMLDALADFSNYSGMEVNVSKCVSVSITWVNGKREDHLSAVPDEERPLPN